MGLYWPNFSLVFLIHLFLYAGVYCICPRTLPVPRREQFSALIAQLGEHCTGIANVVGSNPAKSLAFFSGLCSCSVTAALALMTGITQLLL